MFLDFSKIIFPKYPKYIFVFFCYLSVVHLFQFYDKFKIFIFTGYPFLYYLQKYFSFIFTGLSISRSVILFLLFFFVVIIVTCIDFQKWFCLTLTFYCFFSFTVMVMCLKFFLIYCFRLRRRPKSVKLILIKYYEQWLKTNASAIDILVLFCNDRINN